ncbi:MAG: rRNA maturation RNase YbeY [Lachnospiraceae bacterium]|nr:rRNA maturation RNase YbeY [Lachnospiraceae bacterium]
MTYSLDAEYTTGLDFDYEALYRKTVDATLACLQCPYDASVSLLITDDEGIREINRDTRELDSATDVLSFPMNTFEVPGDFSHLEETEDAFDPDTGELLLGDIVLSAEHVVKQAAEYGHSLQREYAFLITHSMLHLTGFDHMEESDRNRMEEEQRSIMQTLRILR